MPAGGSAEFAVRGDVNYAGHRAQPYVIEKIIRCSGSAASEGASEGFLG
jgi:hypothetical protein